MLPYAECGPPWISRISGYFFDGSKSGGLRIQPWIFLPSKLLYQISSGSLCWMSLKSSSLTCVIWRGFGDARVMTIAMSPMLVCVEIVAAIVDASGVAL